MIGRRTVLVVLQQGKQYLQWYTGLLFGVRASSMTRTLHTGKAQQVSCSVVALVAALLPCFCLHNICGGKREKLL